MTHPIDKVVARVLKQLPEHITPKEVADALDRTGGDEIDAVCLLLNMTVTPDATIKCPVQEKWRGIREVCDAFDEAVQHAMHDTPTSIKNASKTT
jgi:hypothetical protein